MYLLPHWKEWEKKNLNTWKNYVELLLDYHPSLLDTNKLSGSSDFNKLGKKRDKFIKIDRSKFIKNIFHFLNNEKVNFKNFLLGIHLAYAKTKKENLYKKRVAHSNIKKHSYIGISRSNGWALYSIYLNSCFFL